MTNIHPFIKQQLRNKAASQVALDNVGRIMFPYPATVTDNNDPEALRRVKVEDIHNPQLSTDWLFPLQWTYNDLVLPRVGDTVVVLHLYGDKAMGVYLPVINEVRPGDTNQGNVVDDNSVNVPGTDRRFVGVDQLTSVTNDRHAEIRHNDNLNVLNNMAVSVGGAQTVQVTLSAAEEVGGNKTVTVTGSHTDITTLFRTLSSLTGVTISAPVVTLASTTGGATIILSGDNITARPGGTGNITWDLDGRTMTFTDGTFAFTNTTNVSITGKQVATVGALDTGGDTLTTKGW